MFKPVNTAFTNITLKAPRKWDAEKDGECMGLPVYFNGAQYYSWWAVDWKSRIKILFGKPIRLVIFTQCHPPVSITAD